MAIFLFFLVVVTVLFFLVVVTVLFFLVVVAIFLVVVAIFTKLDRLYEVDRRDDRNAGLLDRFKDVPDAFFEECAVDNEGVGAFHQRNLLGRGLKVMWICANGHDRHDVRLVADQVLHHIAQDVGRDGDRG